MTAIADSASDTSSRTRQEPPVGAVQWTEGFWAERFRLCLETIIPSMGDALNVPENGAVFCNFYVAARLQEGEYLDTNWSDGDCYRWMETVAHVNGVTRE